METATETTPKLCRYGNHPIDEQKRFTTFFSVGEDGKETEPQMYACEVHHLMHRIQEFKDTRVLTTGLMTEAFLAMADRKHALGLHSGDPYREDPPKMWFDEFVDATDTVDAAVKRWEREVWFGSQHPDKDNKITQDDGDLPRYRTYKNKKTGPPKGSLQAFVIPAQYKGYRADVPAGDSGGPLTYLSYSMCGRSIFQIDDDVNNVSVGIILDEDSPSPRGGIKMVAGRMGQIIDLIERSILDWKAGRIKWEHKDSVGFGF